MAIHVHTPTADYGLTSACLGSSLGNQFGRVVFYASTGAGTYNALGQDTALAGSLAPADCYIGPDVILADAAAGAINQRLSCQAGLAGHSNRAKLVVVLNVGAANNVTVLDSNGAAIGPNAGTSNVLAPSVSAVFIFNGTQWMALNGL